MRGFRVGAGLAAAAAAAAASAAFALPSIGINMARLNVLPAPIRIQRHQRVATPYGGGRSNTTLHNTNGERECARRRRQIAAGSLTESNGLVR